MSCSCIACRGYGFGNLWNVNFDKLSLPTHGVRVHNGLYGDASRLHGSIPVMLQGDVSNLCGWMSGGSPIGKINNLSGDISGIWGNVSSIWGEVDSCFIGNVGNLRGCVTGCRGIATYIQGDVTNIIGDVSKLRGDVSKLRGDVSDLSGIVDI